MADTLDCSPCYEGRPDYDPTGGTAILPIYNARRSRLFAAGTFFRSRLNIAGDPDFQGSICNDIAIQVTIVLTTVTLNVYFQNELVETFVTSQPLNCGETVGGGEGGGTLIGTPAFTSLRSQLAANSKYVIMPARGSDEQDPDVGEFPPSDDTCISETAITNLSGAAGPPTSNLSSIRTGPDRTLAFILTEENSNGKVFEARVLQQWDYDAEQWIPYVQDADCALPEDRCP